MKVCGVGVAMLSGQKLGISLVDRHAVNVGTTCCRPTVAGIQPVRGQARRRLMAAGGAEAS